MKFKIEYSDIAKKALKKMDKQTSKRIYDWIEKVLAKCENPKDKGKPLHGGLNNYWRYRVGDYRIIAEIKYKEIIIYIARIDHRKQVYKKMQEDYKELI